MVADALTKDSANSDLIKKVIEEGRLDIVKNISKREEQAREDCQYLTASTDHIGSSQPINSHDNHLSVC